MLRSHTSAEPCLVPEIVTATPVQFLRLIRQESCGSEAAVVVAMPDCAGLPTPDVGVVRDAVDMATTRPDPTLVGKLCKRLAMQGSSWMTARVARAPARSIFKKVVRFAGRILADGSQGTSAERKGEDVLPARVCMVKAASETAHGPCDS